VRFMRFFYIPAFMLMTSNPNQDVHHGGRAVHSRHQLAHHEGAVPMRWILSFQDN